MRCEILGARLVAAWTWNASDDTCGICRLPFDATCTDCKLPGDGCPLAIGQCTHPFHLHCILKWLASANSRGQCPLCRQEWQFQQQAE
ncbi:hypothetical protein CDCA_CDCA06G1832 [Cyanidium caldarium]|uniref:Anaphase-promoting complex subunit 11 n=1 Tax=Cyanidium caldarium TaxID=2771 RepID=A0AAV9IU63_CYACA|nr:hypothetical protein CDCA_CDCA06G1832 [Cyanidium caldarium]